MLNSVVKVLLFILTAIPGLGLLLFASLDLFATYYDPNVAHGNPVVSCCIGLTGMLLMLIGVGEWGKWRYLLVFLAMPLSLLAYVFLAPPSLANKFAPGILMGGVSFTVLYLVRTTYRKGDKSKPPA